MRRALAAALLAACYAPLPPAGAPCPDGVCPLGLVCSPATRTCERSAVEADATVIAPVDANADAPKVVPPDAPEPFLYRRAITIQNGGVTPLPAGYTIRVPVGSTLGMLVSQGKVRSDFADLRVIDGGTLGERDRIVDPPSGPAPPAVSFSLAAPIDAAGSATYYLYYGAPAAGAAPANGSAVFPLYDDFETGIASVWLENDAPMTAGGKLVLRAGRTDALTTQAVSDGVPAASAVELIASVADPNSDPTVQPEGTFYYWFGYQHSGDFVANDPWVLWIARGKNQVKAEQKSPVGCETSCVGNNLAQDTGAHYYAIERGPTDTRFLRDGALSFTATVTNSADYSVMIRNYMATSELHVEWIRARARATPEPTVVVGNEEPL